MMAVTSIGDLRHGKLFDVEATMRLLEPSCDFGDLVRRSVGKIGRARE